MNPTIIIWATIIITVIAAVGGKIWAMREDSESEK